MRKVWLALIVLSFVCSLSAVMPVIKQGSLTIGSRVKIAPPAASARWEYLDSKRVGRVTLRNYQAVVSEDVIFYAITFESPDMPTADMIIQMKAAVAQVAEELRSRGAKVLPVETGPPLAPYEMIPMRHKFTKDPLIGILHLTLFPRPEPFLIYSYCLSAEQAKDFMKFVTFDVVIEPVPEDEVLKL